MTAWSYLPNAKYIDQVLADLTAHPDEFAVAWNAVSWNAARAAGRHAAWVADWSAAWAAARDAVWTAACDAAYDAARGAAWDTAGGAARDAIAALVAWDHAANYLTMTRDELGVWYALSHDPAALLLLPYLKAQELISQKIRT